ncbi:MULTISPECIES: hypothetical protein [unclassified Mesorhizobium]|uniref:hypothetical protein n=1 Tax=unclassified Mesorhizobium TaxID=325217 RepID=UPI00167828F9|nr:MULTISPECIES: hypothetical protein [unclassified Mesorhizobium]
MRLRITPFIAPVTTLRVSPATTLRVAHQQVGRDAATTLRVAQWITGINPSDQKN